MVFVDTSVFLARYLRNDQFHGAALTIWRGLERSEARLYTSNFVLDETLTLLGRRANYAFAAERGAAIYASQALRILRPDEADERVALELFAKYADQRVSFTDAVSFALMRRHRLERAFSFDRHFAHAGFAVVDN